MLSFASQETVVQPAERARGRIAVIGAGVAGLAAASLMRDRGHDVHVFDKGRGVGGRLSVRRAGPFEFDHGAQYFTVRDAEFDRVVQAWRAAGVVARWNGRIAVCEQGQWREIASGCRYVGVPGMNAAPKLLAKHLNVRTQAPVVRLERAGRRWRVLLESGERAGEFDFVIVASPAPQAATLTEGHTQFARVAQACPMMPCWAVLLGFSRRQPLPFDGAFIHGSPLAWLARGSSKPGRTPAEAWVLHANSAWSIAHLEADEADVIAALEGEFRRLIESGDAPVFRTAHRWRYARPGKLPAGVLFDADARIGMCGDWTNDGRVEGAFLSGVAIARQILDHPDVAFVDFA